MEIQLHHSSKPSSCFTCHGCIPCQKHITTLKLQARFTRRRIATSMASASVFSESKAAFSFDFRLTVPDQTIEEAEAGIGNHAQKLLSIKSLIDSEAWKSLQISLRESSSRLKQDLYTIIQAKPGIQRPELRKLYSNLFNSVTEMDYAARDKDAVLVKECYHNIASALEEIFMKIQ